MNRALSLIDHKDISAADFQAMDTQSRDARRGQLACLACGADASFRTASAKRSPTFAARHESDCPLVVTPAWSVFRYLQ